MRELQPANDGDLARRLLEIQHAAYAVEARLIGDERIPPLHEDIDDLRGASLTWLGAFMVDRLVGAIAWVAVADELNIDRLMVAPSAHRHGVVRLGFAEAGEEEVVPGLGDPIRIRSSLDLRT